MAVAVEGRNHGLLSDTSYYNALELFPETIALVQDKGVGLGCNNVAYDLRARPPLGDRRPPQADNIGRVLGGPTNRRGCHTVEWHDDVQGIGQKEGRSVNDYDRKRIALAFVPAIQCDVVMPSSFDAVDTLVPEEPAATMTSRMGPREAQAPCGRSVERPYVQGNCVWGFRISWGDLVWRTNPADVGTALLGESGGAGGRFT
jgi:hypothetical protein